MRMKKLIGSLIATVMVMGMVSGTSVNAKVIEPEVVKTETWATSYFIDGDRETLYPYIQCQADIYNNGTVEVSFWNTHEWDGYEGFNHVITLSEPMPRNYAPHPAATSSIYIPAGYHFVDGVYTYVKDGPMEGQTLDKDSRYTPGLIGNLDFESIKVDFDQEVYIPEEYTSSNCSSKIFIIHNNAIVAWCDAHPDINYPFFPTRVSDITDFWNESHKTNISEKAYRIEYTPDISYIGSLTDFPVNEKSIFTFKPATDPTIKNFDCHFRILGHDFDVTSEILSSNTPVELDETSALKAEIESLKNQIAQLNNVLVSQKNRAYGDMNDDGFVDARDASILLTLYARQSVGDPITLDQLIEEQKGQ